MGKKRNHLFQQNINRSTIPPKVLRKARPSYIENPELRRRTEYLKQIYFDSLVFTPEALRHLAAQVGVGQIVLGSDYPFPWQLAPVDHIFASTSFSDDEKADMLGRTAEKLLNFGA